MMTAWRPISTALQDCTIVDKISGIRFLCTWCGEPS